MAITKIDKFRERFVLSAPDSIEDSFYPTVGIKFDFFPRIITGESNEPGLLTGKARKFLSDRDDQLRVLKLDYFVSMLRYISVERPWFVSKINGMASLMKLNIENGSRLEANTVLEIGLKETVDLKIMAMLDAYRSCVYDKKFMRLTLPKNLMRFDMKIYITDSRVLMEPDGDQKRGKLKVAEDSSGVVVFNLFDCEFLTEDWSSMFGDMDNESKPNMAKQTLKVKVGRIYEQYNLPTKRPMGFLGSGYASHDFDTDFNFLGNLFRLNTLNDSELGNVFDIDRDVERIEEEKQKIDLIEVESNSPHYTTFYRRRYIDGTASGAESFAPNGETFDKLDVESATNKTTIPVSPDLTNSNNPVSKIDTLTVDSTENTTSIDKLNVESTSNKTKIDTLTIDSFGGNTTKVEDLTVEENSTNRTSIDRLDVISTRNTTNITSDTPISASNSTKIESLGTVESAENTTKIEKLTIESAPNKTFISRLEVESKSNKTFI